MSNVGDLVQINSGSAFPLKVTGKGMREDGYPTVLVTWTDTEGEVHHAEYPEVCVKPWSNVVDLPVITRLNLDPHRVLTKAVEAGLTGVVIIGYDGDGGDVLWLLERLKAKLLAIPERLQKGTA